MVADYAAALQKEILLQGRFYVTQRHLCFYSNILGWQTSVVVPYTDVLAIEKTRTLFIQNGIAIATLQGRYAFSSFLFRDHTFNRLVTFWRNSQLETPYPVEVLLSRDEVHFGADSATVFDDDFPVDVDEWTAKPVAAAATTAAAATPATAPASAPVTMAASVAASTAAVVSSTPGVAAAAAAAQRGTATPLASPLAGHYGGSATAITAADVHSPEPAPPSSASSSSSAAATSAAAAARTDPAPSSSAGPAAPPATTVPFAPPTGDLTAFGYEPCKTAIIDEVVPAPWADLQQMLFDPAHPFLSNFIASLRYTGTCPPGRALTSAQCHSRGSWGAQSSGASRGRWTTPTTRRASTSTSWS